MPCKSFTVEMVFVLSLEEWNLSRQKEVEGSQAHTFNFNTWEGEVNGSLWILNQPGLHRCFRSTTATEKDPDSKINKIGDIASEEIVKVKALELWKQT